jgi:uncharacterized membrane protein YgcG
MRARTSLFGVPRPNRAIFAIVLAVTLLLPVLATPAWADPPMRLPDQITDKVGALDGRTDEVKAALDRLRADTGLQLFVVYVASFDGVPAQQWTDQTAIRSDLGNRDALLAVATEDRAYWYSFDTGFPLSQQQLDNVAATAIEPALAQNDWAGAAIGAANGYRAALAGQPVPKPQIVPGNPHPGGGSSGVKLPIGFVCVLVVAAIAACIGLWVWWRTRQGKPVRPMARPVDPSDPLAALTTDQLNDRANSLLIQVDDAIRSSERELSLATAQYGEEATASFTAALTQAKAEVAEAFRLRLLLDEPPATPKPDGSAPEEGGPADDAARRDMLRKILGAAESADKRLDAESDAFEQLRELQTQVDTLLPTLDNRRAQVAGRLADASTRLTQLQARYTGQALGAVANNPAQAQERLQFADSALTRTRQELGTGRRPAAALAVRAAEQAIDQAETLIAAVDRVGTDLDSARAAVDSLLTEVDSDVAAARSAQASGASAPQSGAGVPLPAQRAAALADAATRAEQTAAAVRTALSAPTVDPLTAVRQLQDADGALDRALADARDATQRAERARAMLDQAITAARTEIASATDFVNTRRGGVGGRARTLLAEAQRHLDQAVALAANDPEAALAEAQQADRLAEQASQAAQNDVNQWQAPGGFGGGGGGDVAGAILGGILIGTLAGGRRGGGWGGGWGGGGGGFGGSGWGGHAPGGFGGSGSRMGGGGRF